MAKKKKKLSKKKRNKKILVGSGIVVGVGVVGFLGYKYLFPSLKKLFTDLSNKIQGKADNGEELSKIAEFAALGLSERQQQTISPEIGGLIKVRDNALMSRNAAQIAASQKDLDNVALLTYLGMNPLEACKDPKNATTSDCKNLNEMIQLGQTNPNDERFLRFKDSEVGRKLYGL